MSQRLFKLFQTHLKSLATDVLEVVAESQEPAWGPLEHEPEQTPEPTPDPEPEHPFIEIPDDLALQIRDLVQEKQQISRGLQLIQKAFTAQSQRIDALYQELRARYEVPKDPGYVLHISEGDGDLSGFKFLERTFPSAEAPSEEKEQTPADDNSSMNQES